MTPFEVRSERLISIHKGTFLENGEINLLHFFIFPSIYVFKDLCYFEAKIKSSKLILHKTEKRAAYVRCYPAPSAPLAFCEKLKLSQI